MTTSFYSKEELKLLQLKSYGENVKISRFARFYQPELIEIGNSVRIDDFCILSGNITLCNFIHISAYTAMYGKFGITINDYSGISPRCTIFSASDDFSGNYMIGPTIPEEYTNVTGSPVIINKHCQIGAGTIILPSVCINEGTVVGAMSLVATSLEEWSIYVGIPAKKIKNRSKKLLDRGFLK